MGKTSQVVLGNHQGGIRIGATRQKGQLSRVSQIQQVFLRISLELVHFYRT
jgi:hypothetical protein